MSLDCSDALSNNKRVGNNIFRWFGEHPTDTGLKQQRAVFSLLRTELCQVKAVWF